ncbi:MAG TPA: ABC transporter ATP-binding protein [Candidimonas sp.]|nr:ABC transporter ATP-binding protein [Candidimonas sp.]
MSKPLLEVRELAAGYDDIQVLWNVSLTVKTGEIVCLVGSNGAGKTTTLRCLSGLVPSSGGGVYIDGKNSTGYSPVDLVEHGIAHVPEGRRLFSGLSVYDNLVLGAYRRKDGHAAIARDIDRAYALFPRLAERRRQDATTLSGGEQQMCAVARGLMAAPRLLMIDELSLGLAPKVVGELVEALRIVNAEGTSLLIVEQDVATALDLADRGYVMDQGRTVAQGDSASLRGNEVIRSAYLGV